MPLPSGGRLVKFSQDPDLLPHQCQTLLHKYMPEHIRSTKITQRLFVKYVLVVYIRMFLLTAVHTCART